MNFVPLKREGASIPGIRVLCQALAIDSLNFPRYQCCYPGALFSKHPLQGVGRANVVACCYYSNR